MESTDLAREVLQFTFRNRRLADTTDPCLGEPCDLCFAPHLGRVQAFVDRKQPIHFVILAFPSKSPNPTKVLGALPDLAEWAAIEFLQSFCDQLSYYHPPGARITICSDGHVFAETVGISDEDATAYHAELEGIVAAQGATSINFFSLGDAFGSMPYPRMREKIERDHAEPVELIRKRVADEDGNARQIFNGIHRFLFEDHAAIHLELSRNQLREETKSLAYAVIRRSNAWSRLIEARFPGAVRLSIHPQSPHAEKIGFHLLKTRDNWLTPWHGVALESSDGLILVKRFQAEQVKACLVWRHNRPSHYVAPHLTLEEIP